MHDDGRRLNSTPLPFTRPPNELGRVNNDCDILKMHTSVSRFVNNSPRFFLPPRSLGLPSLKFAKKKARSLELRHANNSNPRLVWPLSLLPLRSKQCAMQPPHRLQYCWDAIEYRKRIQTICATQKHSTKSSSFSPAQLKLTMWEELSLNPLVRPS